MGEGAKLLLCFGAGGAAMVLLQRLAMRLAAIDPNLAAFSNHAPESKAGDAIAFIVGLNFISLFLLCTARPIAAFSLALFLGGLLVVLNRTKEKVLREPAVLADAWLFVQAVRFPHLYFPFMPMKWIGAGFVALFILIALLISLETPLSLIRSFWGLLFLIIAAASLPMLIVLMNRGKLPDLAHWLLRLCPVSHDSMHDSISFGPLTAALLHPVLAGVMERNKPDYLKDETVRPKESAWPRPFESLMSEVEKGATPNVVIVQAESFSDIRKFLPLHQSAALGDFLPNWEKLEASGHTFPTPEDAFGAYTMRTEFAVLTGLKADALGAWAFNPYLLAARCPLWSLARFFKAHGYKTIVIHPYARDFFKRDQVMVNLGFDQFLAEEDFPLSTERFGPYISDKALAAEINKLISISKQPVFCFIITIEAHGPWNEGRLSEQQVKDTLFDIDRSLFPENVQAYLCHLRHMDQMFAQLKDSSLWVYGDHRPYLHYEGE